ncbi:MAG: polyprenyl synthetase family protein [Clostridia bacterium]|nr:polyprenyl synthetase family protein [Clostridia bacterium]
MIDIDLYIEQKRSIINQAIRRYLPQTGPTTVIDAIRYSLEAGGKRLRPILVIAVAETIGADVSSTIDVACALEFIHTYSLIHDDLPAMDNSNLRRGKPTCHCVYGEAIAILAGDALLTRAFDTIAKYGMQEGREKKAIRIIAELANAAGTAGMIGGQVLDLEAEGSVPALAEIERIAMLKTGALLKAAIMSGAIAADASEKQQKTLAAYAGNIGPAFQIVDDLLDYESTAETLGKPAGADEIRAKATYPALFGSAEARKKAEDLYARAVVSLEDLNRPTALLSGLARIMVYRNK